MDMHGSLIALTENDATCCKEHRCWGCGNTTAYM